MAKREAGRMVGGLGPGRADRASERLVAVFALGALLFSPAVVLIFDGHPGTTIAGLPLLYVYLFAAWALLIAVLALVVENARLGDERPAARAGRHGEPS